MISIINVIKTKKNLIKVLKRKKVNIESKSYHIFIFPESPFSHQRVIVRVIYSIKLTTGFFF